VVIKTVGPTSTSGCQATVPKVSSLQPKQHTEPLGHIGNDVGGSLRCESDVPRLAIEVFDVIGAPFSNASAPQGSPVRPWCTELRVSERAA
jgi:hypothetical protein